MSLALLIITGVAIATGTGATKAKTKQTTPIQKELKTTIQQVALKLV